MEIFRYYELFYFGTHLHTVSSVLKNGSLLISSCLSELAAEFISRPGSLEVVEGEKAEFTCSVSKETFEVKWFKDDKELEAGDKYQMVSDGKRRTFIIKNCEPKDEGGYVVMIGATRANANLTVLGEPRPSINSCQIQKKKKC